MKNKSFNFIKLLSTFGLLALINACAQETASPESDAPWEHQQKAKIVEYLINIVDWPKEAVKNQALTICLVGQPDNTQTLLKLDKAKTGKYTLAVTPVTDPMQPSTECHLVYIAQDEKKTAKQLIEAYRGKPVLLIADIDHFADDGGNINFIKISDNEMGISVNLPRMRESNLNIDMTRFQNYTIFPDLKNNDN